MAAEHLVLLTGATGFIGRALCDELISRGGAVRAAVRQSNLDEPLPVACELATVGAIGAATDWSAAVKGVDAVVHLAARVHVMRDSAVDPLALFREINVAGTERLARAAAAAGVRRFIYLSSIKVNGEGRAAPYVEADPPEPADPYAVSKWEAEQVLMEIGRETGMEIVVLRPALVYGPGVKANFLSLMKWVDRGVPLPLGAVTANKRSLLGLDNLVDLIATCVDHPAAANQIFLVSDGEALSTAALLQRMGASLGRPARLIPVPITLLKFGAMLLGRSGIVQRLCGSLEVNVGKTRVLLGWSPPVSVDEGLRRTAMHWKKAQERLRC